MSATLPSLQRTSPAPHRGQADWDALAKSGSRGRSIGQGLLMALLVTVSVPILLPYFWMFTISVSARTGGVESAVLWRSIGILVPAVLALGFLNLLTEPGMRRLYGAAGIVVVAGAALAWAIGPDLHLQNWAFLRDRNFVEILSGRGAGTVEAQFPSVWTAFGNSLLLAGVPVGCANAQPRSSVCGRQMKRLRQRPDYLETTG